MNYFLIASLALISVIRASSATTCNGQISGQVNGQLRVTGDCTLLGAMVNGIVEVSAGGKVTMDAGTTVNGGVILRNAGSMMINGHSGRVTINGNIEDHHGTDSFSICNAVVTGSIKSVNRHGEIVIGGPTCGPIFYGPIDIEGGSERAALQSISNTVSSLVVKDRAGTVYIEGNSPISTLTVNNCIKFLMLDNTISGEMIVENNRYVSLNDVYLSGNGVVRHNKGDQTILSDVNSIGGFELSDNGDKVTVTDSNFNSLSCFGNLNPVFTNVNVNSGSGQCAGL